MKHIGSIAIRHGYITLYIDVLYPDERYVTSICRKDALRRVCCGLCETKRILQHHTMSGRAMLKTCRLYEKLYLI